MARLKEEGFVLDLVEQLYRLRCGQPALLRKSPYTIDRKGPKDDARLGNLLRNSPPVAATLYHVNKNKAIWEQDPAKFWRIHVTTHSCEPQPLVQVMIAGSYVAATRSDT